MSSPLWKIWSGVWSLSAIYHSWNWASMAMLHVGRPWLSSVKLTSFYNKRQRGYVTNCRRHCERYSACQVLEHKGKPKLMKEFEETSLGSVWCQVLKSQTSTYRDENIISIYYSSSEGIMSALYVTMWYDSRLLNICRINNAIQESSDPKKYVEHKPAR